MPDRQDFLRMVEAYAGERFPTARFFFEHYNDGNYNPDTMVYIQLITVYHLPDLTPPTWTMNIQYMDARPKGPYIQGGEVIRDEVPHYLDALVYQPSTAAPLAFVKEVEVEFEEEQ